MSPKWTYKQETIRQVDGIYFIDGFEEHFFFTIEDAFLFVDEMSEAVWLH